MNLGDFRFRFEDEDEEEEEEMEEEFVVMVVVAASLLNPQRVSCLHIEELNGTVTFFSYKESLHLPSRNCIG